MNIIVNETLWKLEDERIDKLHRGDMSVAGFISKTVPADPWNYFFGRSSQNNQIDLILNGFTAEDIEAIRQKMIAERKELVSKTGGLTGRIIYENKELFRKTFPELEQTCDEVESVIREKKCKGCGIEKIAKPLLDAILEIDCAGRDLGEIAQVVPGNAIKRLETGQPVPIEEINFSVPKSKKRFVPARKTPLVGEPKLIERFPEEPEIELPRPLRGAPKPISALTPSDDMTGFKPCVECIVKHLGEAHSLISEVADGYDSLIEITGAFRAAELHAERWPALRGQIREARKAWFARHEVPPWSEFNKMVVEIIRISSEDNI